MPKIQVRRGTGLELGNVIPDVGEPFYITDTKEYGYGDGVNRIDELTTKTYSPKLHSLKSYLDEAELLTDEEGLSDVKYYAHSTYDSSKFTPVSDVTVTTDGVASNFSSANIVNISSNDISTYNTWLVTIPIKYTSTPRGTSGYFSFGASGVKSGIVYIASSHTMTATVYTTISTTITTSFSYELAENTQYFVQLGFTGTAFVMNLLDANYNVLATNPEASTSNIYSGVGFRVGLRQTNSVFTNGVIDLKGIEIIGDGVPVFNGNITGSDSYTIGGNTVTIPYTLSKTGSKIVNSVYRDRVQSVYEQFGYAPYYTLSDTDFTLPMGEIYGLMLNQSTPHIVETYQNGTSWYRVYSDGWCEQGGSLDHITSDNTRVDLLKTFVYSNYTIIASIVYDHNNVQNVYCTLKAGNFFNIRYTGTSSTKVDWRACGYLKETEEDEETPDVPEP